MNPDVFWRSSQSGWRPAGLVRARGASGALVGQLDVPAGLDHRSQPPPRGRPRREGGNERLERDLRLAQMLEGRLRCVMAIAGHELGRPLREVAAALDQCARDERSPTGQQRLASAQGAVDRLADGLAWFARYSSLEKAAPVNFAPLSAALLLNQVAAAWRMDAWIKGLRLATLPSDRVLVSDSILLSAALNSLVGNAVKHADRGGVMVGCRREAGAASLCVYDTGPGVPARQLEILFDAVERGDPAPEGLGLGLSVLCGVTTLLGYGLRVRSVQGRGTCFAITGIPQAD